MKYKIAHIDEDPGSINNIYQYLKNDFEILKIQVTSGFTIEGIAKDIFENSVNAIITDYLLEEEGQVDFNGNKIVDFIRSTNPHFPIVMLTAHQPAAISHMDDVHIIYSKDIFDGDVGSDDEIKIFKLKLNNSIKNYYSKIVDTRKRIEELVGKRNEAGLLMPEEEELSKLFILMDELEPEAKDMPSHLIQKESITQLTDFVKEAKDILELLKKNNNK